MTQVSNAGVGSSSGIEADMIDSTELMMVNNKDFFADDIYDYKETFMRHSGDAGVVGGPSSRSANSEKVKNGNGRIGGGAGGQKKKVQTNGIMCDMYDGGEDDEYEEYDNEREGVGVIYEDENGVVRGNYDDDDDEDEDDFRVKPTIQDDDDDDLGLQINSNFHNNFVDDVDMGMGETFFKRVDSMELVKPKKTKIISNYLIGELLGDGSYGKVKECLDMSSLARRAVKIINLKMVQRKIPHGVENVRKEIRIMARLNHKNLIRLYGTHEKGSLAGNSNGGCPPKSSAMAPPQPSSSQTGGDELLRHTAQLVTNIDKPPKLYIFMDYCITSLEKLLKAAPDGRLRNYQAAFYFRQLVDGLEYLHSLNIIHNDIKPGNLLLTCDDVLKICDFSISADLGHFPVEDYLAATAAAANANSQNDLDELNKSESFSEGNNGGVNANLLCGSAHSSKFPISQCTPMFQCPEMLDENMDEVAILREAPKIDIWSSGVTLYQLTTGDLPFKGSTIHQIFELIRHESNPINMPSFIDRNLAQLLLGMLNRNPIQRFNIKQIRDTDWFKKKHPMIREELAPLPIDALQNETSTYRMLNYLEKYCRPGSVHPEVAAMVNHGQIMTTELSQPSSIRIDGGGGGGVPVSTTPTPVVAATTSGAAVQQPGVVSSAQAQQSNLVESNTAATGNKKYGQATKAKRNHCSVM